jgi:hypothetical protein
MSKPSLAVNNETSNAVTIGTPHESSADSISARKRSEVRDNTGCEQVFPTETVGWRLDHTTNFNELRAKPV